MTQRGKTTLYWIAGIATAFGGVAVARLMAPQYAGKTASYLSAGGQLMALMGLVVIAFGVRQRVWAKGAEQANTPSEKDKTQKREDAK